MALPQSAQAQTILPSVAGLNFQTSGPSRCDNIGDWYTTTNNINNQFSCPVNNGASTSNPAANRLHRFSINITPQDLINAGGAITVSVLDAESNGARDEIDALALGVTSCATAGINCDPTRFALLSPAGATIQSVTVAAGSADGTVVTFPAITTPGVYQVTSETGAGPILGTTTTALNDDDNSFTIQVSAIPNLLIGQFQGSVQQNTGAALPTLSLYFLTGPGTSSLFLRNFDLDSTAGNPIGVSYISPPGGLGSVLGTTSGNARWNGAAATLDTGGDTVPGLSNLNDAGTWTLRITNFTSNNQAIFELNTGAGVRLPVFDNQPQTAGNFVITPSTTLATTIGVTVDHPFTVTNNFLTTDIINLAQVAAPGSDANYTVQLLDSAGNALPDTDGDGVPDTGILQPGQTGSFILRVTPNATAVTANVVNINATSFMDREVRSQAGTGAATIQSVTKTTTIPAVGGIGDLVFEDTNGNGVQDGGELGRVGVTVTLRDSGGNVVATTTTDANGNYQFTNVPTGSYSVTITLPSGFGATTSVAQNVTLSTAGQVLTNVDFGIQQLGAIGDRVFNDFDGNGAQNGAESGFGGITVTLRDGGGNVVATTTTDATGNYQFANVFAGTYTVTATPPAGFTSTTPNPQTVTLTAGQTLTTVDFGLRQIPGTIGDLVFNDLNGNGTQDAGETGRSGVTVTLTGTDVNGNPVNLVVLTDVNGNYQFTNVLPGNYTVTLTAPAGFAVTTTNPQPLTLTAGQAITNIDFGLRQLVGTIGDTVFNDIDGNGTQTAGELGLAGVTVTLTGTDSNGNAVNLTTVTDANGNYQFTNVLGGNYTVTVTPPASFSFTTLNPLNLALAPGQTVDNADFGLRQAPGTIGDRVFNDFNGDGIQNGAEGGLAGVTVTLTGTDINGNAVNLTTTTNVNGSYQFTGVTPGNYTVTITPPATFVGTTPTAQAVVLTAGQGIDTVDFGLRQPPGTIGDLVFNDLNGNGVRDPGEPGLPGSTLTLRDAAGNAVATTTSDANGNYQFANVPPGTYTVTAAPPAGFTAIAPNPQTVTLAAGQTVDTIDFSMRQVPGTIGDRVFNDLNGNGIQDGTEAGIGGVTLVLQDAAGNAIATTVTDANGNYQFTNTPPGSYTIRLTPPGGFNLTTGNGAFPVTLAAGQSVTNVDFGLQAGQARLRLVKRITTVLRSGASLASVDFSRFVDDPADPNDTAPGWSQLSPIGVPRIAANIPLQSADEIEYTIYFLSDGGRPTLAVNLCDLIASQTQFVNGSLQVKLGNSSPLPASIFLTPLAPLPNGNSCVDQSNPNGAIVVNLGDISNSAGSNFGFVRFRVRIS